MLIGPDTGFDKLATAIPISRKRAAHSAVSFKGGGTHSSLIIFKNI
jgi:hypothetical protein